MTIQSFSPNASLSLYVKNILVFEEPDTTAETTLPFFADGFPGLMFQQTEQGLTVQPHNKQMPPLFLYGQTVKPIALQIRGSYQLVVFQLYPFVLKSLFNLVAKEITDECYDLQQAHPGAAYIQKLAGSKSPKEQIAVISRYLLVLLRSKKRHIDQPVKKAIQIILEKKGQVSIKEVCTSIHLTARTFERRFLVETGILPKQFSKIIQFQESLQQLSYKESTSLTDIVYSNGFADQSHFIRVFKAYTGSTPKSFLAKK